MQAPERGPRAPEGKDRRWAPPVFVSGSLLPAAVDGGSIGMAASPRTGASAGFWSLPLVCFALEKDSRLKRDS